MLSCVILRFTSGATPADYGGQAFSIHMRVDVPSSIGGGLGLEPMTVCVVSTVLHTILPLLLGQVVIVLSIRSFQSMVCDNGDPIKLFL